MRLMQKRERADALDDVVFLAVGGRAIANFRQRDTLFGLSFG